MSDFNAADKKRAHAERMLTRAKRHYAQAAKRVALWENRMRDLDRLDRSLAQPTLWPEEESFTTVPNNAVSECALEM